MKNSTANNGVYWKITDPWHVTGSGKNLGDTLVTIIVGGEYEIEYVRKQDAELIVSLINKLIDVERSLK